jgi:hypothetical protein
MERLNKPFFDMKSVSMIKKKEILSFLKAMKNLIQMIIHLFETIDLNEATA